MAVASWNARMPQIPRCPNCAAVVDDIEVRKRLTSQKTSQKLKPPTNVQTNAYGERACFWVECAGCKANVCFCCMKFYKTKPVPDAGGGAVPEALWRDYRDHAHLRDCMASTLGHNDYYGHRDPNHPASFEMTLKRNSMNSAMEFIRALDPAVRAEVLEAVKDQLDGARYISHDELVKLL